MADWNNQSAPGGNEGEPPARSRSPVRNGGGDSNGGGWNAGSWKKDDSGGGGWNSGGGNDNKDSGGGGWKSNGGGGGWKEGGWKDSSWKKDDNGGGGWKNGGGGEKEVCRFFQKAGWCKEGDNCKYKHEEGGKGKGKGSEDWDCPKCGDSQFARNVKCRKCGTARPGLDNEETAKIDAETAIQDKYINAIRAYQRLSDENQETWWWFCDIQNYKERYDPKRKEIEFLKDFCESQHIPLGDEAGAGGTSLTGSPGGPLAPGAEMCGDFRRGTCTRGDSCRFSHVDPIAAGLFTPAPVLGQDQILKAMMAMQNAMMKGPGLGMPGAGI